MFKYSKDQLLQMKRHLDDLRILEGDCGTPLTPLLLGQLVNMAKKRIECCYQDINGIFDMPGISLCGCLGPQDGDLYCPCRMSTLRYKYRYDIALEMLRLESGV